MRDAGRFRPIVSWIARFTEHHALEMLTTDQTTARRGRATDTARRFQTLRTRAINRLVLAGMPRAVAEAWVAAWDESTAQLTDFRAADDFWDLGYRYAVEEHRRGYRPAIRTSLAG